MRCWQSLMIGLARSGRVTDFMHNRTSMQRFAARYVAGRDAQSAVERAKALHRGGLTGSLFYLGEYVDDPVEVAGTVHHLEAVIPLLAEAGLDAHVSVDPTQIGTMISWDLCRENALRLARAVADAPCAQGARRVLVLDMEDSSVTERTLGLHEELRAEGLPVGVTVQAYLHRTLGDLESLAHQGSFVRLVKGAFAEGPDLAHTRRPDIAAAYRNCLEILFSQASRESGAYPVVGSHDERMIEMARELARTNGWAPDQWEVEMLLGVRPGYQRELADRGVSLRLYLPFGRSWWPYSIRRVGENPKNLGFVLRSAFSRS